MLNQLDVMQEALQELLDHLKARAATINQLSQAIATFDALNHQPRQRSARLCGPPFEPGRYDRRACAVAQSALHDG
jgi:hypothetical protein